MALALMLLLSPFSLRAQRARVDPAARLSQAKTLIDAGRVADGLAEIDRAIAASSGDPEVRFEVGKLLRELAERRFAELQRLAPDSAPVRELAGRHHELQGRLADALREYRAALALEPHRHGLHYQAGSVLWRMREIDPAEAELRVELKTNPGHGLANLRLGQVLLTRSDEKQAVTYLESAVKALPASAEAHRELGKAYRKVGRNADAQREWELVAKTRPQDDQVHFLLGGVYRELGKAALAQRELATHRAILERRRALAEKR